jgi:hypothetical protein
MSGPLASWAAEHSKAGPVGRAVLVQYALAANHDGSPSRYQPALEDLARRTGYGRSTVIPARADLVARGELIELEPGGGRGLVGRYSVPSTLCPPEGRCWPCALLAELLGQRVQQLDRFQGRKGPAQARKGPADGRKGPAAGPTTETETYHSLGGTSPPGESSAALAPDGAALEPGQPKQERQEREDGDPVPIPTEVWAILNGGRPRVRRSTAEEREAEEREKRARALRLLTGPSVEEGTSA